MKIYSANKTITAQILMIQRQQKTVKIPFIITPPAIFHLSVFMLCCSLQITRDTKTSKGNVKSKILKGKGYYCFIVQKKCFRFLIPNCCYCFPLIFKKQYVKFSDPLVDSLSLLMHLSVLCFSNSIITLQACAAFSN